MSNENILEEIRGLLDENTRLKENNINLLESIRAIKMRESLYQSQLQNTKNALQKLYQNIDTTPHSRNSEYQRKVYGDGEDE